MAGPLDPKLTAELIKRMTDEGKFDQAQLEPEKRSHTPMHLALGAMGAGQAADILTTNAALKRPHTSEANPLYGKNPSMGRLIATSAATTVPLAIILDKIYNKHPKLAQGIAYGMAGLSSAMAARNSKVGK